MHGFLPTDFQVLHPSPSGFRAASSSPLASLTSFCDIVSRESPILESASFNMMSRHDFLDSTDNIPLSSRGGNPPPSRGSSNVSLPFESDDAKVVTLQKGRPKISTRGGKQTIPKTLLSAAFIPPAMPSRDPDLPEDLYESRVHSRMRSSTMSVTKEVKRKTPCYEHVLMLLLAVLVVAAILVVGAFIGNVVNDEFHPYHPLNGLKGACSFRGTPGATSKGLNGSIKLEVKDGNVLDVKLDHNYLKSPVYGHGYDLLIFEHGDIGHYCFNKGPLLSYGLEDDKSKYPLDIAEYITDGYLGSVVFDNSTQMMIKDDSRASDFVPHVKMRVSLIGRMLGVVKVSTVSEKINTPFDCCIISVYSDH